MALWVEKWKVPSETSDREYTVAKNKFGEWGCDCAAWKFQRGRRHDCKHIAGVKSGAYGRLMSTTSGSSTKADNEAKRDEMAKRMQEERAEEVVVVNGLDAIRANAKWGVK